jgi:hypothetical protein
VVVTRVVDVTLFRNAIARDDSKVAMVPGATVDPVARCQ